MREKGWMVRRFDEQGRLLLPIEMRRALGWDTETPLEILSDGMSVLIRKNKKECIFCRSEEEIKIFEGKPVCKACILELQKA